MRDKKKTLDENNERLKFKKILKKQKLKEQGITLIALVVTIIILLILAGVTLNIALSDNGLFSKAKKAADDYNKRALEEELQILYAEQQTENYKNNLKAKADITKLLEEKTGEGKITQEDITDFNEKLKQYGYEEEIKTITSESDFAKIGTDDSHPIDGLYVQLGDIALDGFTPIGTEENPFTGVYNGNGKKITSLTITTENDSAGMFGISEGTIKNVTVEKCTITSSQGRIGAIAGVNEGLIENCIINSGKLNSSGAYRDPITESKQGSRIGGICGENGLGAIIKNCVNSAEIIGNEIQVGGISGRNFGGIIAGCINNGAVKGPGRVGGIVGWTMPENNSESEVKDCTNNATVEQLISSGETSIGFGGIAGYCSGNKIYRCGNNGAISSSKIDVGGIVGYRSRWFFY